MTTILYMFWTGFSGAALVNGPLIFPAATAFVPGAQAGGAFVPGAQAAALFQPGAQAAKLGGP